MKRKWKVIAPLAISAAGALAAGIVTLMQKVPKAQAPAKPESGKAPAAPAVLKTGSYSFVSGFKDAATVEMQLDYDPEKFSFSVISEEYLNPSSDSHVAVLWGEDYHIQMEYAAYFPGENFETMSKAIEEKFKGFTPVRFGANEAVRYLDGDSYGIRLRIPDDENSYLLLTVVRAAADPEDFAALPEEPAFAAMLGSIRFSLKR